MTKITEKEFARICSGLREDREKIIKHNPIGTDNEILLWMLLGCLNSYLDLSENEIPCFPGRPGEKAYRDAIVFVLQRRAVDSFDVMPYIESLCTE